MKEFKLNCVPCANGSCITPSNQKHLIFSNDKELTEINCNITAVKSIKVENCPNLIVLDCLYNEITSIEINNCPNLKSLNCYNNFLTSLDISNLKNLSFLDISSNNLSEISMNDILFNLIKNNFQNGILKMNNQSVAKISPSSLEYVAALKQQNCLIEI